MDESVVKVFEEQRVGKLKLSEAIRIGAKLRPQAFYALSDGVGTCAMGAANEAVHGNQYYRSNGPWAHLPSAILVEVVHRNNEVRQTREEIADWLESKGL